jgi:hypothetical protein
VARTVQSQLSSDMEDGVYESFYYCMIQSTY